jgi:Xaa-Pro aminopeptidase
MVDQGVHLKRSASIGTKNPTFTLSMITIVLKPLMSLFSGYDGWSFYTPQTVLVPADDGEEPVWLGREMDVAGGRLTAWMDTGNVVGFPESYVQHPDRHPMDWIAEWIAARGWGKGRIGIELEAYYFSPKAHPRLTHGSSPGFPM